MTKAKKAPDLKKRHSFFEAERKFCGFLIVPFFKWLYGVEKSGEMSLPEGPCVVLYNHVTDFDAVWIIDAFHEFMYCVASEHLVRVPIAGAILKTFVAPILKKKGTNGAGVVLEMSRILRAGYKVLLAPEGLRSGNGRTGEIAPVTAAVLQKLKCPVVMIRIHGGFLTTPRWGKGIRKGCIRIEKAAEYSKEEIASMSEEEFYEHIIKDLAVDAYENPSAHKGKRPAENIELQLYLCPSCKEFGTIRSKKKEFFCNCGLRGTIDEYGMLKGEKIPYRTVTEWDFWQRDYIDNTVLPDSVEDKEAENGVAGNKEVGKADKILLRSHSLAIHRIEKDHKDEVLSSGDLVLTVDEISVGEVSVPIAEILDVSIYSYGILLIATKDGKYYEIKGKQKYPGEAYLIFIKKLNSSKGEK